MDRNSIMPLRNVWLVELIFTKLTPVPQVIYRTPAMNMKLEVFTGVNIKVMVFLIMT
jgi:hypothetical protein